MFVCVCGGGGQVEQVLRALFFFGEGTISTKHLYESRSEISENSSLKSRKRFIRLMGEVFIILPGGGGGCSCPTLKNRCACPLPLGSTPL